MERVWNHSLGGAASDSCASHLLDAIRAKLRLRHYSPRTEEAYLGWIRRFVAFSGVSSRSELAAVGPSDVARFRAHLAEDKGVSVSTQNQASAAITFLFRGFLSQQVQEVRSDVVAEASRRAPVVLSPREVDTLLSSMTGVPRLQASLLYGSGLRLMECCRLRVMDVDLEGHRLRIRRARGSGDRVVPLPRALLAEVGAQLAFVRAVFERDLREGAGWVDASNSLPEAAPRYARDLSSQWLFPATRRYLHRETGQCRRHHLHETVLQSALRRATLAAGFEKRVTCHTLRHSFAARLLGEGRDLRSVQELLGHRSPSTTKVHTRIIGDGKAPTRAFSNSAHSDPRSKMSRASQR